MLFMLTRRCPLCGGIDFFTLLDLGLQPLANQLFTSEKEAKSAEKYDLSLLCCNDCMYVWLNALVSPERLFSNNTYLTCVSKQTQEDMYSFAKACMDSCNVSSEKSVLDIASNDGTLLTFFKEKGFTVLGVEPSINAYKIADSKGITTINDFFNEDLSNKIVQTYGKFYLVTATNLLTHIADPVLFLNNCKSILQENGSIVLEFYYFESLISNIAFDQIYHEHVSYFNCRVFNNLVKKVGMEIYNINLVRAQGGSLRVFLGFPNQHTINNEVENLLRSEGDIKNIKNRYITFANKAMLKAEEIKTYLLSAHDNNKKILGYGASAKATVVTNFSKIDNSIIMGIADQSPLKQDKFIPGTGIRIIKPEKINIMEPEVIVIFSWNLKDEIIQYLKNIVQKPTDLVVFTPYLLEISLGKEVGAK